MVSQVCEETEWTFEKYSRLRIVIITNLEQMQMYVFFQASEHIIIFSEKKWPHKYVPLYNNNHYCFKSS